MKKASMLAVLLVTVLTLLLAVGCSDGISSDEAKAHISGFLDAIEADAYEQAATFLHPDRPTDLRLFFEGIQAEAALDFSAGTEITKYTGLSSSNYDSTVDGSTCTLDMGVAVGDKVIQMKIEIVSNASGYGIYNLNVDT